jgi:hypothetical protein
MLIFFQLQRVWAIPDKLNSFFKISNFTLNLSHFDGKLAMPIESNLMAHTIDFKRTAVSRMGSQSKQTIKKICKEHWLFTATITTRNFNPSRYTAIKVH